MAVSAKDVILHLGADPKAFDRGMKDAQRSFKGTLGSFEKTSSGMSTKMKLIWAAIAATVAVAVTKIVKKIINVGKELLTLGQKSLSLKKSFQSLAQAAGVNFKKILVDMQIATRGTVAEIDMLAAANRMMLLGLDPEIFGEVMEIARRTAKATGQDINYMVESLSMGLGRQSKMILDNLGIIISISEAHEWYAETLGKTSAQLTENEKKLAFQTFAMKVARENVEKLGEDVLTLTEVGAVFTTEWKDLKAFIGEKLVEAIGKVIEKFGGWERIMEDVHFWVDEKMKPALIGLIDKVVEVGKNLVESGKEIYDKYLPKLVKVYDYFKDDLIPALIDAYDEIKPKLVQAFKDLAKSLQPVVDRLEELVPQMAKLAVEYLPVIVEKIGKLVEWFTDLGPTWKKVTGFAIGFGAVLIPIAWIASKIVEVLKFLTPAFTFLGGIWSTLISIGSILATAIAYLAGVPVWLVIAAITALIGIGILLWKNWDKIKDFLIKTWDKIKAEAVKTWENIKIKATRIWKDTKTEAVQTWDSVRDFFINLWESIKTKATEMWDSIKDYFANLWEDIKQDFQNAWDWIKKRFYEYNPLGIIIANWDEIVSWIGEMWERIKNIFITAGEDIWAWMLDWVPFLNLIVTEWGPTIIELFRDIWEKIKVKAVEIWGSIKEFFRETWDSIKEKATEIWESIKEFFVTTWDAIKDKTTEVWNSIKEFFALLWEDIKIRATEIWNSIKEFFVILWEDIRIKVIEVWSSIKDFFVEIWEGIKADFTFALEFVKNLISTAFYFIKDEVIIPIWNDVVNFFRNIWDQIIITVNTFKDNFLRVWNSIKEGLKSPINAMIGLINSFLSRIESGMNSMISALNRIGFKVPDWLGEIMPGLAGREFGISISKISIPKIPKLQLGGLVTGAGFADIGERGTERVFLPRGAQVVPLEASAAGIINYYFYISSLVVREEADIHRIAQQLESIRILGARARGIKE